MRYMQRLFLLALLGIGTLTLQACDDGPVEDFGEGVDDAARQAGEQLEDACEEVTDEPC